jgi:cell division protein FtsX
MKLWSIFYRLKEAREGIARNTWASVATIMLLTLTLLIFAGFLAVNVSLSRLADLLESQARVRIFPTAGTRAQALVTSLQSIQGVGDVELVSGQSVYDELAPVFGRQTLLNALPADAFTDSLSASLAEPRDAAQAVTRIRAIPGVGEVIWGQGFAKTLYDVAEQLHRGGLALVTAFLIAAFLMSLTAMHLAVLNREVEIEIQHLVGVGPWGIRAQFLLEALLLGVLSAAIAASLFLYLGEVIQRGIASMLPFMSRQQADSQPLLLAVILVTGPVLSVLGGGLASQRAIGAGDR